MTDLYIFGFGLAVTILVGSGLAMMIIANRRTVEVERSDAGEVSETPMTGAGSTSRTTS